jgi:chaperonin cofactor prefoldin
VPLPLLYAALDEAQARIREIEGEMRDVRARMQELKTTLYARFGSSINLED